MRRFVIIIFLFFVGLFFCPSVFAQEKLTLSITPPLIKNNVNPGQIWKSYVKLVNNNPKEMDIYIQVVDFKSGEETGTVKFLEKPEEENDQRHLLSQWIVIENESIRIPAYKSKEIPFIIDIPEDAEPGGHYAAILAGTRPIEEESKGSAIKISSLLASLILLNVDGEIIERGRIREFSTDKKYYFEPKVDFSVRFENIGNVHIQPRGEIRVYNFWDKERGVIQMNHNTDFGNVLPQGIRKWNFSWEGEKNLLEMGRYKAVMVLNYGEKQKETVDQTLYFWVIYLKPLLITISGLLIFIILITLFIRLYIKRAIIQTQKQVGIFEKNNEQNKQKIMVISEKENKVIDLKEIKDSKTEKVEKAKYNWKKLKKYLIVIMLFVFTVLVLVIYINYYEGNFKNTKSNNLQDKQNETGIIEITNTEANEVEIIKTKDEENIIASNTEKELISTTTKEKEINKNIIITVLNGGGKAGAASRAKEKISNSGFTVDKLGNADNFNYENTLIKYKEEIFYEASELGKIFFEGVKYEKVNEQKEDIIIIIGKDF